MEKYSGSLFLLVTLVLLVASGIGLAQWNGEIVVCGINLWGQCNLPFPDSGFVAVAAGYWHSLGLRGSTTGMEGPEPRLELCGNYPNPFSTQTVIRFATSAQGLVTMRVFDLSGRLARTLVNEEVTAANHSIIWGGRNSRGHELASGVYFIRLNGGEQQASAKALLVR